MKPNARRPTPSQLACDPELATLAALDLMLELTRAALLAQHQDIGHVVDDHPLTTLVCDIIDAADSLRILLRRYRASLARLYRNKTF